MNNKLRDANELLNSLAPETLAELSVLISQANGRREDFVTVNRLSSLAFDLGQGKASNGLDFTTMYFDACIEHGER